jgi:hypothetical protein
LGLRSLGSTRETRLPASSGEVGAGALCHTGHQDIADKITWSVGQVKGQGAFSEYTIADENICYKIPDGLPLEQAATVPLAAATAWMALFRSKSLHIDRTRGSSVQLLVWAGSSEFPTYLCAISLFLAHIFQPALAFMRCSLPLYSASALPQSAALAISHFFAPLAPSTSLTIKIQTLSLRFSRFYPV